MAITLNDQVYSFSPKSLDGKYGKLSGANTVPYASVAEANASILVPYRHQGLMVTIDTGTGNTLYWYKEGTADGDLVPFNVTSGVTSVDASATGALQFSGGPVVNTGTLALAWTGTNAQVVMGDGSFSSFPTTDLSNYYTKTELQTAGQSTVDWANIVNAPVIDIPNSGITGGVVSWVDGLTFHVTAADYYIDGVHYTSPATDITLDAADGTNPRLDVLAVTSAGTVVKITGTAGPNPSEPQVDYYTQLKLTSILLGAGATTPTGIIQDVIYDEGVEWAGTSQGTIAANFLSSAITPFKNSFEVSTATYSDQSGIMFSNNVPVGISNDKTLNLHVYSTEAFTGSDDIKVQFLKNGVAVSDVRSLPFSKSTVNLWQYVSFLLTDFTFSSLDFNQVKFIFTGSTTTRSVYFDYILLQDGIPQGEGSTPTLQGLQDVINVNNLLNKNNDINIATGKTLSIQSEDGNNYVFVGPANTELYATSNDGNSYTSIYSNPGNGGSSSIFVEAGTNVGRLSMEVNKGYWDTNLYDASSTLLNNFKMDATGFTLKTLEAQSTETKMLYYDPATGRVKSGDAPSGGTPQGLQDVITVNPNLSGLQQVFLGSTTRLDFYSGDYSTFAGPFAGISLYESLFASMDAQLDANNWAQVKVNQTGAYFSYGTVDGEANVVAGSSGLHLDVGGGTKTLQISNLPTATTANVLYFDSTTKAVTYGAAPSGGGSTYTVDNGLTENVAGNFQLGGTLLHDTTITGGAYNLKVTSTKDFNAAVFGQSTATSLGMGVYGLAPSAGVTGESSTGMGLQGLTASGNALNLNASDASNAIMLVRGVKALASPMLTMASYTVDTNGTTPTAGIGGLLSYGAVTDDLNGYEIASAKFSWTDIATASRTGAYDIYVTGNAVSDRKLRLAGSGQLTLDKYTSSSAFTGTAVANLAVDASGNVLTVAAGGGGSTTASNGLHMDTDVKLGGTLTENTTINGGLYTLDITTTNGTRINTGSGFDSTAGYSLLDMHMVNAATLTSRVIDDGTKGLLQTFASQGAGTDQGWVYLQGETATSIHTMKVADDAITMEPAIISVLKLLVKSLPTYADETAAATAGLTQHQVYKTSTGELRIKL